MCDQMGAMNHLQNYLLVQADAKSTPSYSSDLHFLGNIMQMSAHNNDKCRPEDQQGVLLASILVQLHSSVYTTFHHIPQTLKQPDPCAKHVLSTCQTMYNPLKQAPSPLLQPHAMFKLLLLLILRCEPLLDYCQPCSSHELMKLFWPSDLAQPAPS